MKPEEAPGRAAPLVHRLLVATVELVCRFPRLILGTALTLCAISIYASSTRLEYRTQRSDLISPHKDYQQRWHKYLAEFGDDDDIVVVVQGKDSAQMKQALDALAGQLARETGHFDRLFYQVDLRHLRNRALLFLPKEQIAQIQNNLKSMSLLLDFAPLSWQSLTLMSLLREAEQRLGHVHPGEPLKPADDQFLTQLASISRSAAATLADPARYHNPWGSLLAQSPEQKDLLAEPQYFFSGDGSLAFLLVRPIKEAGSFTAARASVDKVRAIVANTQPRFPNLTLGLTGLPVLETDEMVAAQRDTSRASWLAIGGVTLLFFVVYRSIYYPLLTVATLLVGTSWALGWMTLTVGHVNILSATFAVMLIGMGDYGVLWVMRYERERRLGADVRGALRHTALCVGSGTLTAAATTGLAFFAAALADFQAVAELGWIAGSGVLLCALSCFTVLPALLQLADHREFAGGEVVRRRGCILRLVRRRSGMLAGSPTQTWLPGLTGQSGRVMFATLILVALLGVFACRVNYDHNLLHLQARDLESVKWELTLIDHTAGASWHALSYTDTAAEALALKARYEKLPEVSRVVEVASLVPPDQDQKLALLSDIQRRLRSLPERGARIPHARPSTRQIASELTSLRARLAPLAAATPKSLLSELHENLAGLEQGLNEMAGRDGVEDGLRDFEERMTGDLASDLYRLRDVSTPTAVTLAELPAALRERYLGRSGKWLLQVFGKDCLWEYQPLAHFVKQIRTVDPEATGKPFATVEGLRAMKDGFQSAGMYALMAIVIVLGADFRRPARMLMALSPLAIGIVLALGIMGLFGVPLNPANMIAMPLILGVGVDNGVHLLHDCLADKAEGTFQISGAIGRGVLVKAMTTMIGFGTLMVSTQRGLITLGFCLTLGVGCCMIAALLFLPAVLHFFHQGLRMPVETQTVVYEQQTA
jgi:hopanoid biosynthesis associated RND transporter like protein HpnN